MDIENELKCVIYDEVHYINDPQRGGAWEGSMSMLPKHVVQVMLSATIDRPEKIPNWFRETLNQEVVLCPHTHRSVPLRHHCFTVVKDSVVKKIRDRRTQSHFVKYSSKPLEIKGREYNVDAYRNTKKMISYLTQHNIRTSPHFALQKICEYLLKNNLLPEDKIENNKLKRNSPACIIYTSGTGGNPKGVILSHGGILNNLVGACEIMKPLFNSRPVFLTWLPLSHSYEHCVQFAQIAVGAKVFYAEKIEKLLENISEAKPTITVSYTHLTLPTNREV